MRGFTLAGVMVIMTIMMVFVAYTVPRQWSTVMQRDRELQTIFLMQQYARAIHEFSRKNGNAMPVSMEQLQKAKLPRYLRGKVEEGLVDPLTGQVDWLIIPAAAAGTTGPNQPGTIGGNAPGTTTGTTPASGTSPATGTSGTSPNNGAATPTVIGVPMKDYAGGPFIGIRPGKSGQSFLEFNGAQNYEGWSYTVLDYRNAVNARITAASKLWQ
jgi:type II secretory pathway pseudopilin PulG